MSMMIEASLDGMIDYAPHLPRDRRAELVKGIVDTFAEEESVDYLEYVFTSFA